MHSTEGVPVIHDENVNVSVGITFNGKHFGANWPIRDISQLEFTFTLIAKSIVKVLVENKLLERDEDD